MARLSEQHAGRLLLIVAALGAVGIVALSLAPPWSSRWANVFIGPYSSQLALLAIWSTLGISPWYVRWSGAAVALWFVARPLQSLDLALWKLILAWDILPPSLLLFTLLCGLRWRNLSWAVVVPPLQTAVWRFADQLVTGRSQSWWRDFVHVGIFDAFYLTPLLTALLLARAAGYRLSWTAGRKE